MNVFVNQIENKYDQGAVARSNHGTDETVKKDKTSGTQSVFIWNQNENSVGMQAYRTNNKQNTLLYQAAAFDEKNNKDYMVVMSQTMSGADYKKLQEEGVNPADCTPGELVTVMDQIKVTLAKAGVEIAGFTDDLDLATIEATGVSEGYAGAIANACIQKNIPVTEDNIMGIASQMDQMQEIKELSESARQYLIENDLPPTFENLYKATYATGKGEAVAQGYFQTDSYGYMAKKGEAEEVSALYEQINRIVEQAGLGDRPESLADAQWLLKRGLMLTDDNLHYMAGLDAAFSDLDLNSVALAAADAIAMGLPAKEGNLLVGDGYQTNEAGYIKKAEEINEKVQLLADEDISRVILDGRDMQLYNLFSANAQRLSFKEGEEASAYHEPENSLDYIRAKKQLTEIRLSMSATANLKLLKQGIQIDLEPLNRLSQLLQKEESLYHATALSNTQDKLNGIKTLPADTIGITVKEAWMANRVYTLDHVCEVGKSIAADYQKAEKSYEAMMTTPSFELGDNIRKAFQNVDALLEENGMIASEENRKAVRILGYNGMEISEENVQAVRESYALLQKVVDGLTPQRTLQMLRDGVNPMEMNLDELSFYLESMQSESEPLERYSHYLYKLEKNNGITAEEKDAYIGIYRLLRQIEKGDDAAIGMLVQNRQELSFDHLLQAVRTKKRGFIDEKIDDAYGLLREVHKNGTSISDQIMNYYQNRAGNCMRDMEKADFTGVYADQELFAQMQKVPDDVFSALSGDDLSVTAWQVISEQMLSEETSFFSDLKKLSNKEDKEKDFLNDLKELSDSFEEGKETVQKTYEVFAKRAEDAFLRAGEESGQFVDARSYAMDMRQVSLWKAHAGQENYYIPMQAEDHTLMVQVKIVNGEKKGIVTVDLKQMDETLGRASAVFIVKDGHAEGFIRVAEKENLENYRKIADKCCEAILEKTGKTADITCVYNQTLDISTFYKDKKTESNQELYLIAKSFIQSVEKEVHNYESEL